MLTHKVNRRAAAIPISWRLVVSMLAAVGGGACGPEPTDLCDLPAPSGDVAAQQVAATLSGDEGDQAFEATASLSPGGALSGGGVTMPLERDEQGGAVLDRARGGDLPICIRFGESGPTTNTAQFSVPSTGRLYLTDDSASGSAVIDRVDGDSVSGYFAFDARRYVGGDPTNQFVHFSGGRFRVPLP